MNLFSDTARHVWMTLDDLSPPRDNDDNDDNKIANMLPPPPHHALEEVYNPFGPHLTLM